LTLRDVLALARGTSPAAGTPVALDELTDAFRQLVQRAALQDAHSARKQREWLAQQFDTEATNADS
jgi:hypothetical protein